MLVHGTTNNSDPGAQKLAILLDSTGAIKTATGASASQVQGNVASGATDSGNPVKVGGVYKATPSTLTDGQRGDLQVGTRGSLNVSLLAIDGTTGASVTTPGADAIGTGAAASFSLATRAFGYAFNGTSWDRTTKPNATSRIVSAAASTNDTVAKAAAGSIHQIIGYNANASIRYLKLYNKATSPTVGTDTPTHTFLLLPLAGFAFDFPLPFFFSAGIAYALTTGSADADTGALTAGDILCLNISYS